jgi:hypothetical protein
MIHPSIFGGEDPDKSRPVSAPRTAVLPDVPTELGRGLAVRRVFTHFQNLNLRVLIDNLQRGQVTAGNWSFADTLCPVAHGMPSGQAVGLLRYICQAVDLRRACLQAAQETGVPARHLERFVLSWDSGAMSPDWLLAELQSIWAERQADADAVQCVLEDRVQVR